MLKFLLLPLMLLSFWASPVAAAADDPTATIVSVEGNQMTLKVTGDTPSWARPGVYLKATDDGGKIVVRRAKISKIDGGTILVTSPEAKNVKVGSTYKLGKARVNEGC